MDRLDLRGLSCPLPVVNTKRELKKLARGESLEVVVDTGTSRDNVTRMATKEGCEVEVRETEEGHFVLTITRVK
ncbi:MAG: sulfurtransferase TusA family protein [Candidatus Geothermincolales bacterium]